MMTTKKTEMSEKNTSTFTHGMLLGTVIGVTIGVFLFPPQGSTNRKKLKKIKDKASEKLAEVKPNVDEVEKIVANQITNLTAFALDNIDKRKKKDNKNAAKRNFFKASF